MPARLQRKRTKGYKMPENTQYVGRPTKWGNPFKLVGGTVYINAGHRRKVFDKWVWLCEGKNSVYVVWLYALLFESTERWRKMDAFNDHYCDFEFWRNHFKKLDLSEIRSKNLACFCSLETPCHADFLLKIANQNPI